MEKKTNYDVLDEILKDSQRDRTDKVWVKSKYHPDGGYLCDESEANVSWQTIKDTDAIERYLRS